MVKFVGVWPALVTPLTEAGRVNVPVVEQLVEDLLATGIGGLYVCGGTGEGVLLAPDVRREMAEATISVVAGRLPVMVHIGAINTADAIELAEHADLAGADAISAVPPFYFAYGFEAIRQHYCAISEASAVPLYVYFIPGATGTQVTPEQLLEICALAGIAGLKYSSHDLHYLSQLMARRDPDRVNILSGPDELFLPCLALGVEGCIGTTYNFMPRLYVDIMQSFLSGELAMARRLQFAANDMIGVLLRYGGIPSAKALLTALGYAVGFGVPPMPPIAGERAEAMMAEYEAAGLRGLLRRNALHGVPGDPMRGRLA